MQRKNFTSQQIAKLKEAILDPKVVTYWLATPYLKQLIVQDDPRVVEMPKMFKDALLAGDGLLLAKNTVLKYLEGKLDERNTFVFDNSDIRVLMENSSPNATISSSHHGLVSGNNSIV